MGGNQISTPAGSAQSSTNVNQHPCELTLIIWQDGKVIGRVTTTHKELAVIVVGEGDSKDTFAEIRSSLCDFYFDALDSGAQRTKSLDLSSFSNSGARRIRVEVQGQETFYITCHVMDKIKRVKEIILEHFGIPTEVSDSFRIVFDGARLADGGTLSTYEIQNNDLLECYMDQCGGGAPYQLPVDLSNPAVKEGKGVYGGKSWQGYWKGFNVLGLCTNPTCISKGRQVCVKLGYPKQLILTDSKNVHKCPACQKAPITTRTYLVAAARAKITFRKAISEETETLVMESPTNHYGEYTKLLDNQLKKGEEIEYDYVEITTTKFGLSFNNCQLCNESMEISEEKVLPCGRAFHESCLLKNGGCPVCQLPEYKFGQLPDLVASRRDKYIRLDVPNHLFGKCSAARATCGPKPKHIGGFLKGVISMQFENLTLGKTKIPITELQQNFVHTNLAYLIKNSEVTEKVLARLRELSILSKEEQKRLNRIQDEIEKCQQLYKIVPTRPSGIAALMTVLGEAGQHRAVVNLSMFDTMLTTYSKK